MNVIGVAGFIGSGKGTVGEILVEQGYKQLSFAGHLKDAVSAIFRWPRNLLEGDTQESREFRETVDPFWSKKFGYDVTPRIILQKFGTDVCRNNFLDTIWVDSLEAEIYKHDKVVITDVRFPNEIDFLSKLGATIIHVDREETRPEWYDLLINDPDQLKLRSDIHPSEYLWFGNPGILFTIDNNKSVDDLRERINILIKELDDSIVMYKIT